MTTKKAMARHFLELKKNVTAWQALKLQDRAFSKQGNSEGRKQHRPSLDYCNKKVRTGFKLFMEYENYPIFLKFEEDSFYITKRGDALVLREATLDEVYRWAWQWDSVLDELEIRDAGEIPMEESEDEYDK